MRTTVAKAPPTAGARASRPQELSTPASIEDDHVLARDLGFTDAANFGRLFRRYTGLTPAAYKAGKTS